MANSESISWRPMEDGNAAGRAARRTWIFLRGLCSTPGGALGTLIVLLYVVLAIGGNVFAPQSPNELHASVLARPSRHFLLGTDEVGRDELSRLISATRVAMLVAIYSVGGALVFGTLVGVVGAYVGGFVDRCINAAMDVLFSFPPLLAAIAVVAVVGGGVLHASLAIALVYVPRFARIARASTLGVKHRLYVDAARVSGIGTMRILRAHILPNIAAPLIVLSALSVSTAQLAYAALSFLGLGAQVPQADFGSMLATGREYMILDAWVVAAPAVALVALVIGFNLFGDAVRDVLDPRRTGGSSRVSKVEIAV